MRNKVNFLNRILIVLFISSVIAFPQNQKSSSIDDKNIKLENLSLLKDKIIQYHSSGQYNKDMQILCSKAWNKIKRVKPNSNSTVVFDIDETTLSNYSFLRKMDFGYIPFLWDEWIDSAKAPAIKPVKALYDSVITKGFKVVFISGRRDYQYEATVENLKEQGFNIFDTLITKSKNDLSTTTSLFKEAKRIELSKKGYKIVASVGDQYSDMYGKDAGIKVKLIDYMYFIK